MFIRESPTPWHAVSSISSMLKFSGYELFTVPSDKLNYKSFTIFNGSLIAIRKGQNSGDLNKPILIIAAHTDSPCLKLKPISKQLASNGLLQLGVQTYGNGIWHSWFDRDLRISGTALVKEDNVCVEKLFMSNNAICTIPNVAIHLLRTQNDSFAVNKEIHLKPIFGMQENDTESFDETGVSSSSIENRHDSHLIRKIGEMLGTSADCIIDVDACLSDITKPAIGGSNDEFLFAPRLDNLSSCFSAIKALTSTINEDCDVVVACFNHEEIGSQTDEGALTHRLYQILKHVGIDMDDRTVANNCFIVSADAAHGFHPNFSELYENVHRPKLDGGPVVKTNANGRYATTMHSANMIRQAAKLASVPIQEFVMRNDMACGSTVGPFLASKYGIRTVDIGIPILSMHSIREMMACNALSQFTKLLESIIKNFNDLSTKFVPHYAHNPIL
ncbi:hypothetical protein GJ496_003904 [Pomphorhynchus laevis]|nr:hypothetical protein GJ496_003904 [Pomphorhynchus laevis]